MKFGIIAPNGNVIKAPENGWRWSEASVNEKIATGEIIFKEDNEGIIRKIYLTNQSGRTPENLWLGEKVGTTREATTEIKQFFGTAVFDTPKPVKFISEMLRLISDENAIILDFFAGSGTTADAVMQLNNEDGGSRKFILATLDEVADSDVAQSAGFNTIDEISRERIKRVSQKIKTENPNWKGDTGFKHFYVKEMEAQTMDKIIEFDPTVTQLLPDNMVAEFERPDLETTGTDTILQTWLINDGYKFDTKVEKIHFNQNSGYHIDNRLYIIDEFTQDDVKVLLDKIGNSEINISTIIVFGYSISSDASDYFTTMTGLKNNTKTNLDGVKVEVRY